MRNHWTAPVRLALLGSLAVVALGEMQPTHAIINGTVDGNLHPNVGMVVAEAAGVRFTPCSGSLVAPQVFVTVAHCLEFIASRGATQVWVTFDSQANPDTSTLHSCHSAPESGLRRQRARPQRRCRDHVCDAGGHSARRPSAPGSARWGWLGPVVQGRRLRSVSTSQRRRPARRSCSIGRAGSPSLSSTR